MSFRQIRIYLDGPARGGFGRRETFVRSHHAPNGEKVVVLGDACVGQGVRRIELDGALIRSEGFGESIFGQAVEVKAPAQIRLERLRVVGATFGKSLALIHRHLWNE